MNRLNPLDDWWYENWKRRLLLACIAIAIGFGLVFFAPPARADVGLIDRADFVADLNCNPDPVDFAFRDHGGTNTSGVHVDPAVDGTLEIPPDAPCVTLGRRFHGEHLLMRGNGGHPDFKGVDPLVLGGPDRLFGTADDVICRNPPCGVWLWNEMMPYSFVEGPMDGTVMGTDPIRWQRWVDDGSPAWPDVLHPNHNAQRFAYGGFPQSIDCWSLNGNGNQYGGGCGHVFDLQTDWGAVLVKIPRSRVSDDPFGGPGMFRSIRFRAWDENFQPLAGGQWSDDGFHQIMVYDRPDYDTEYEITNTRPNLLTVLGGFGGSRIRYLSVDSHDGRQVTISEFRVGEHTASAPAMEVQECLLDPPGDKDGLACIPGWGANCPSKFFIQRSSKHLNPDGDNGRHAGDGMGPHPHHSSVIVQEGIPGVQPTIRERIEEYNPACNCDPDPDCGKHLLCDADGGGTCSAGDLTSEIFPQFSGELEW